MKFPYKILILFLGIAVFAGFLATIKIFEQYHFTIEDLIKNLNNVYFLAIPFLTFINLFFRFLRWNFLLRSFGFLISSRKLLIYYFVSYFGNITPLYFLYLLRLVPIPNSKIKSFLILLLDLGIEFLSVVILFYFYNHHLKILFWGILLVVISFFLHYYLRSIRKFNFFYYISLLIFIQIFSILIWYFTSFSLYFSLLSYDFFIPIEECIRIYHFLNLSNVFSIIPSGIYFTGQKVIFELIKLGIPENISISSFFILRIFTTWTAVGISLIFFIYYRRVFFKYEEHFDFIADEYKDQISEHIRKKVLEKKININIKYLPIEKYKLGLDAGCGQGWYIKEMMEKGYQMYGFDYSKNQVLYAIQNTNNKNIIQSSILSTPFSEHQFDFIYTINVLHHLKSEEEQKLALQELYRILKIGGRLIIHEINVLNPLYKFYMSYIFPLIHTIDEGIEIWLNFDKNFFINKGFRIIGLEFFTFLPDFIPYKLLKILEPIENKLENSKFIKKFSAHFAIILEKVELDN